MTLTTRSITRLMTRSHWGMRVLFDLNQYRTVDVVHFDGTQHDVVHIGNNFDQQSVGIIKQGIKTALILLCSEVSTATITSSTPLFR